MVALTGIERANPRFRPVRLGLSRAFYVDLIPRRQPGYATEGLRRHLVVTCGGIRPSGAAPTGTDFLRTTHLFRTMKQPLPLLNLT